LLERGHIFGKILSKLEQEAMLGVIQFGFFGRLPSENTLWPSWSTAGPPPMPEAPQDVAAPDEASAEAPHQTTSRLPY
jgi:hypothetical protein